MKKILPIIAVFLSSILLVGCFSNIRGASPSTSATSSPVAAESTSESKTSSESEPNEEITSPASSETEEEATSNSNFESGEDSSTYVTTETEVETTSNSNFESGEDSSTYVTTETEVETTSDSNLEYSEDSSSSDTTENATTEETTGKTEFDDSIFEGLTYAAFGDSITYGADFTRQYAQMDYPYPTLVSNFLSLKGYNNYAISGSTIATNVDDLPSIYHQCLNASAGADIVSVLGGVNDYNRNVELGTISDNSTTTFYGSLKAICETLLDKYPDAFIFLMTPYKEDCYHEFPYTQLNYAGYNLEDYANAVKAVGELYNIPVLDMFNEGQFELEMYNANSDGIHPSQEFIREYTAPQIAEFIRQNYKTSDDSNSNTPSDNVTEETTGKNEVDDSIFEGLSYAAFGDSITFGLTPLSGVTMSNPYPQLVGSTLGFSSVYNEGYCGGTVAANNVGSVCVSDRILSDSKDADIISVMLGVNDYANSLPLGSIDDKTNDTVYGGFNLIANFLTSSYENAFVFFMTPYKFKPSTGLCTHKNKAGYTLEDVANAVKQVAARYNIPVLDMYNCGQFELEMYNENSDGVHPSQEFIREYTAPQIAEFIRQNYKTSDDSNSNTPSDNVTEETTGKNEVDDSIFEGLSYAAFGDSITKGTNLFIPSGLLNPSYPEEVKNILNLKSFKNYGVAGADLCYINKNFSSISYDVLNLTEHYDIISVNGGINDWNCDNPLGTINDMTDTTVYGSLNLIAEYLTNNCSDTFYFFITPYNAKLKQGQYNGNTGYDDNKLGYSLEDVATAYKEVGAKYNIPVLDLFKYGNYEVEMYDSDSDGVHPNQDFILEYTAPQIAEFIRQNYKGK